MITTTRIQILTTRPTTPNAINVLSNIQISSPYLLFTTFPRSPVSSSSPAVVHMASRYVPPPSSLPNIFCEWKKRLRVLFVLQILLVVFLPQIELTTFFLYLYLSEKWKRKQTNHRPNWIANHQIETLTCWFGQVKNTLSQLFVIWDVSSITFLHPESGQKISGRSGKLALAPWWTRHAWSHGHWCSPLYAREMGERERRMGCSWNERWEKGRGFLA